jgi:hypothetical protein
MASTVAPIPIDVLQACLSALRSYQNGNSSPELAEEIANALEFAMACAGVKPLISSMRVTA